MKKLLFLALTILLINCTSDNTDETNNLPILTTNTVTDITSNTAISGGNISDNAGVNIITRGICWNTNGNPTIDNDFSTNGSGIGEYSIEMSNLESETNYYVRAFATNSSGTSYGNELNFTTLEPENIYNGNDISLFTQQEVNNFGSNNYTIINASIQIGADGTANTNNSITNLNALNTIKSVKNISIYDNNALINLNGLNNLEIVENELRIWRNNLIPNLNPLSNLTQVQRFEIQGNNSLTDINGIINVTNLNYISISSVDLLTNIDIFSNISNLDDLDTIYIGNNNSLTNINGLNNITTVNHLYIVNNSILANLCGITNIVNNNNPTGVYSVYGNLFNPTLDDISNGNCSN